MRTILLASLVAVALIILFATLHHQSNPIAAIEPFENCINATGTDYIAAKAAVVAHPDESTTLAQKILQDSTLPWERRIIAQAILEEINDPLAYAAARQQLILVAFKWSNYFSPMQQPEVAFEPDTFGIRRDPTSAPSDTETGKLYRLLAKYPGLIGETILKATVDSTIPLVAGAAVADRQRAITDWKIRWEADRAGPKQMTYSPPEPLTGEEYLNRLSPADLITRFHYVKSTAALAAIFANTPDTIPLLKTIDKDLTPSNRSFFDRYNLSTK